jgi:hypothetical protein
MSFPQSETIVVTTDAGGDATAYTPVIRGTIESVQYVKDDFATGVDFDVTLETTGIVVWDEDDVDASTFVAPRAATHSIVGAAATYDGTRPVLDKIPVAHERVKIVVASGGDTKTGTFRVIYS